MAVLTSTILHFAICFLITLTTLETISAACDSCGSRWRKVYENDQNGSAVSGNVEDLFNAAEHTEPVRFVVPSWGTEGYASDSVYSKYHKRDVLCFFSTTHVGKKSWDTFLNQSYRQAILLCTTGYFDVVHFKPGTGLVVSADVRRVAVQWFIKQHPCSEFIINTYFEGQTFVSNGSLAGLYSSIEAGHDVKVASSYHSAYSLMNIDVSKQGVILAQMFWLFDTNRQKDYFEFANSPQLGVVNIHSNDKVHLIWHLQHERLSVTTFIRLNYMWYVDSCWKHVFTNDENGKQQGGSISELISAVESGHRVKVVIGNYSIEVDNVRTQPGQVSVQLLNRMSFDESDIDDVKMYWSWQMVHTTGTVRTRVYTFQNSVLKNESTEKKTVKWFVDTRPWSKVLSTNKNGNVTFGSKADLRKAILNGAEVRVALKFEDDKKTEGSRRKRHVGWWGINWWGIESGSWWGRHIGFRSRNCTSKPSVKSEWMTFKANNLELGPPGEVSAQLLQSVSTEEVGSAEFKIKDEPFWRSMIVTTQGNVHISQRRVGNETKEGHFSVKQAVNWFVNY